MVKNKILLYIAATFLIGTTFLSCTDLHEELYDRVTSDNFIQTEEDVHRTFLRAFEHSYWTIQGDPFVLQEDAADQLMTPNRRGDWLNGGVYARLHHHEWRPTDSFFSGAWTAIYQGADYATNSIEDLKAINPSDYGLTDDDVKEMIAELRTLRAWLYLRLFDLFRNIEIVTKIKGKTEGNKQASPKETFSFIERELKEAVPDLLKKGDPGTEQFEGRWTKAAAMALLARLYLNAEVYIDKPMYHECAKIAQDIIDGKYGNYRLEKRWDAIFDYDNNESSAAIFEFPTSFGRTHWQYTSGMYWWMYPYKISDYFGFTEFGDSNPKFSMQPGRDIDSVEYSFDLGKPFIKFQKYSDDVRLKKYKNTGGSTREGMFLYGYLTYNNGQDTLRSSHGYKLYIRDRVGHFLDAKPGEKIADKESDILHADQNSGIDFVKYPFYPDESSHKIESDYVVIRLAEIYYMLAECKFRAGDRAKASKLLNTVRKRYYPKGSSSLYAADGSDLTKQELLDEWGREFLVEERRRTDLIRFGKFTTGTWWDKQPDGSGSDYLKVFPIGKTILDTNPQLDQNPGY
jgi:hypothetical protein